MGREGTPRTGRTDERGGSTRQLGRYLPPRVSGIDPVQAANVDPTATLFTEEFTNGVHRRTKS